MNRTIGTFGSVLFGSALATLAMVAPARAEPTQKAKSYQIEVKAPDKAEVGKAAQAQVVVKATSGMHVNLEYPSSLTVAYPAGVEGAAGKLKPAKIDKVQAQWDLGFTARQPGQKVLTGIVRFAVCNDAMTQCEPGSEKVQVTVNVK